jgi:hypothetical protein
VVLNYLEIGLVELRDSTLNFQIQLVMTNWESNRENQIKSFNYETEFHLILDDLDSGKMEMQMQQLFSSFDFELQKRKTQKYNFGQTALGSNYDLNYKEKFQQPRRLAASLADKKAN